MNETHDYTDRVRRWGHDLSYRPGGADHSLIAQGWSAAPIKQGDYLLLSNPSYGHDTRYQIRTIRYSRDPLNQWFATLDFAPR